ncbi:hypothetical protein [Rhizobium ruizarguesonis]|jgi:hypothetical protein|uniref:hypothetical protein n=1 Tax=Rhizobium ruizarguesonis TaxID=2081791 RepID=UPI001FDF3E41|nr:hypothetical protein [Rhizobium ruizarguesonis]
MNSPNFWTEAFIRGGGGGMLGDFVNSSVTRGGDGITQYLTGPGPGEVISATGDVAQWLGGLPGGKDKVNGKTFAQHVKAWVPGSSLWYTKGGNRSPHLR